MNFVHRIIKSSSASSSSQAGSTVQKLVRTELQHAKLVYFGEFHGEPRIISFQTQLVMELARCYASIAAINNTSSINKKADDDAPTLHLIMEHFSVDMQEILDRYQQTRQHKEMRSDEEENKAFEELITAYNEYGTEGHNLHPYRELIQLCRESSERGGSKNGCKVKLHGGFIPRNQAARLNKEAYATKQEFFQEMSSKGYLPKENEPMHQALFEETAAAESLILRGSREHRLLIQSLTSGVDIYSPVEKVDDIDNLVEDEEESKMARLYQAQLLKDHAMAYKIAKLMMEHAIAGKSDNDKYMVITGLGHLKHYTGVPDCLHGYLRQEALLNPNVHHRNTALDLLLSLNRAPIGSSVQRPSFSGIGSTLIGCQMMYEIYLEETYPPMIEAAAKNEDNELEEDIKRKLLKELYLQSPGSLDQYILNAETVRGPLLQFSDGLAGFQRPCADFLFVYDEDEENIIDEADLREAELSGNKTQKCPFHHDQSKDSAKAETIEAYERVGQSAGLRGNATRAKAIMTYLGYSDSDLEYIGENDIFNFQGVANPHPVANIQQGEVVLDIGSGLGIDSFLAAKSCGGADKCEDNDYTNKKPFVVGVDIAQSEVNHATKRAIDRGLVVPERIRFIRGDVESLDDVLEKANLAADNLFDVCISNGAFCLVPDKRKAFENVFKALRPGGRMAISTTTVSDPKLLDPSFDWPLCVKMFANLNEIHPLCESIGFKNVQIIDAESPLEGMELPDDGVAHSLDSEKRFKIHGKYSDQYEFLHNMDMDALCKVVTVYGEKP